MDISKIDRRSMAETAQFLHFKDPETGKPIMDGDSKVGAMVKGFQARSVQAVAAQQAKAALVTDLTSKRGLEDFQQDLVQSAVMLTTEIVGVTIEGQAITHGDFARFYDCTFFDLDVHMGRKTKKPGSFAQQAVAFATEVSANLTDA
ncbi:MAG: hypothetical protein U5N55_12035 [Cypionkella sp.]|nr:hypothetical protein [Cypionkella sp.]